MPCRKERWIIMALALVLIICGCSSQEEKKLQFFSKDRLASRSR